jgi:hypothetical protein
MQHANTYVLVALGLLAGCGDNSSGPADAPDQPTIDSRPGIDAPDDDPDAPVGTPDAPVGTPDADTTPDAPPAVVPLNLNGDFETGDMSGWICNGDATCTVADTDQHAGTYAASAVNLPNDYSGFRVNVLPLMCPDDITCATGENHTGQAIEFRTFIKNVGAATAVRIILRWNCTDTGANGYQWLMNQGNPTADAWNEYVGTFTVPACNYGGSNENLYFYTGTEGATEIRMDDLTIVDLVD